MCRDGHILTGGEPGWRRPWGYSRLVRTTLLAGVLVLAALAGCGDDDDSGTTDTIAGPAPSADVTAAAYADEWNALSQSLSVHPVDNEAPSTESDNWQLRLDPDKDDADKGWALMNDFAEQFSCEIPVKRQPEDDVLVVNC
jgi:hypothetical protein